MKTKTPKNKRVHTTRRPAKPYEKYIVKFGMAGSNGFRTPVRGAIE